MYMQTHARIMMPGEGYVRVVIIVAAADTASSQSQPGAKQEMAFFPPSVSPSKWVSVRTCMRKCWHGREKIPKAPLLILGRKMNNNNRLGDKNTLYTKQLTICHLSVASRAWGSCLMPPHGTAAPTAALWLFLLQKWTPSNCPPCVCFLFFSPLSLFSLKQDNGYIHSTPSIAWWCCSSTSCLWDGKGTCFISRPMQMAERAWKSLLRDGIWY